MMLNVFLIKITPNVLNIVYILLFIFNTLFPSINLFLFFQASASINGDN